MRVKGQPTFALREAMRELMSDDELMTSFLSAKNAEKDERFRVINPVTMQDLQGTAFCLLSFSCNSVWKI